MKKFIKKIYMMHVNKVLPFIPTYRIPTVTRISLNKQLKLQFGRLKQGRILDVGSSFSPYKNSFPYVEYLRLDINEKNKPDICCDIHDIKWQSEYFDIVIATEVLEHCYSPEKAISEIFRVMKPGGICILSTRFIYKYHADPKDYYRFTKDSLNYLFNKFSKVEIYHHGNRMQVLWDIFNSGKIRNTLGVILNLFNPIIAKIHFKKTSYPCGFIVYAKK